MPPVIYSPASELLLFASFPSHSLQFFAYSCGFTLGVDSSNSSAVPAIHEEILGFCWKYLVNSWSFLCFKRCYCNFSDYSDIFWFIAWDLCWRGCIYLLESFSITQLCGILTYRLPVPTDSACFLPLSEAAPLHITAAPSRWLFCQPAQFWSAA